MLHGKTASVHLPSELKELLLKGANVCLPSRYCEYIASDLCQQNTPETIYNLHAASNVINDSILQGVMQRRQQSVRWSVNKKRVQNFFE